MAFPLNDQVYTKSFTPREYEASYLDTISRIYSRDTRIHTCARIHDMHTYTRAHAYTRTGCLRNGDTNGKRMILYEKINPKCKITFFKYVYFVFKKHNFEYSSNVLRVWSQRSSLYSTSRYAFVFTNIVHGEISFLSVSVVYIRQ